MDVHAYSAQPEGARPRVYQWQCDCVVVYIPTRIPFADRRRDPWSTGQVTYEEKYMDVEPHGSGACMYTHVSGVVFGVPVSLIAWWLGNHHCRFPLGFRDKGGSLGVRDV